MPVFEAIHVKSLFVNRYSIFNLLLCFLAFKRTGVKAEAVVSRFGKFLCDISEKHVTRNAVFNAICVQSAAYGRRREVAKVN